MFHAARQDVEIFFNLTGAVPAPLFDTQIAAMVCGFGDAASYETLVGKLAHAALDKSSRFTDWSHRPLTERQNQLRAGGCRAFADGLRKIAAASGEERPGELVRGRDGGARRSGALSQRSGRGVAALSAARPGRTGVFSAYCARWRRGVRPRRSSAICRAAASCKDEAVLEIASHVPNTIEALARTRSLGRGVAEGKLGGEILDAIGAGSPTAGSLAAGDPGAGGDAARLGPLLELLRVLLKQRCEEHQVAQKLVASADDLEAIAADDEAAVPALSGWRYEIFGKDAVALKHGRLALTVRDNRIVLVEPAPQ